MIRDVRAQKVLEALEMGEFQSGSGLNQEIGLARPGDRRWGSHFRIVLHIITMYPTILEVLVKIGKDPSQRLEWTKVRAMVIAFESFEFVFHAHLMLVILGHQISCLNHCKREIKTLLMQWDLLAVQKIECKV